MTTCELCEIEKAPYKCPTCRIPYCSTNCYKTHKTKTCFPPALTTVEPNPVKLKSLYRYPTEDTVPTEKLSALRESNDIKNCLNNPHVRKIMRGILDAEDPTDAIAKAMTEPIFIELADACLHVVEPPN